MCNITLRHRSYGAPDSVTSMVIVAFFLGLLAIIGIIGNVITIIVITRSRKLKSVFNTMIISLCCSDLMSSIISFVRLYCFTWDSCEDPWLDVKATHKACSIGWRITNWMTFNTAVHITGFAAMRFVSIKRPSLFPKFTITRTRVFIVSSWTITFVCGFVLVFFRNLRSHRMLVYSVIYISLSVLMTLLSVATAILIYKQRNRRKSFRGMRKEISDAERRKRCRETRHVIQLLLIVGSFLMGYIPRAVFILRIIERPKVVKIQMANWAFAVIQYFCLRVSECLNPVFYNIGCRDLFKETRRTLLICCYTCGCADRLPVDPDIQISYSSRRVNQLTQNNKPLTDRETIVTGIQRNNKLIK